MSRPRQQADSYPGWYSVIRALNTHPRENAWFACHVYFLSCCVLVTILVDRVRSRGHLAPSRSTFQSTAPTFPGRWQPVKSVGSTVTVPYKTGGSSGLLVRDDIAFSRAWHANMSGSPAPEVRLPGLQIRGRKLQSRSNRARKRDLSQGERSVRDRARPHTLLIDAGSVVPLERRDGLVEPRWFCRLPWVRRRLRTGGWSRHEGCSDACLRHLVIAGAAACVLRT